MAKPIGKVQQATQVVTLNLTDLRAELEDGYLKVELPSFDLEPQVLLEYARDTVGTRTPDALVDRLVNAIQEHMVAEVLAGRTMPSMR